MRIAEIKTKEFSALLHMFRFSKASANEISESENRLLPEAQN
jgi:hypothetical protein